MPRAATIQAVADTPLADRVELIANGAITENDIVIVNGTVGGHMQATRADADLPLTARGKLWVAIGNAADGGPFEAVRWRLVRNVNTAAWASIGDAVYLSATGGGVVAVEGAQGVQVGEVLAVSATVGAYVLAPSESYGGSPHLVRRRLVAITAAQVLALNATPIALVPAQGADTFIEFVSAHLFLDFNTIAYDTIAAGEDLLISYTNGAGQEIGRVETTGFLDAGADAHRLVYAQMPALGTVTTFTPVANAALVISLLVGEVATGNSPLLVEVFYRVRDLTPA